MYFLIVDFFFFNYFCTVSFFFYNLNFHSQTAMSTLIYLLIDVCFSIFFFFLHVTSQTNKSPKQHFKKSIQWQNTHLNLRLVMQPDHLLQLTVMWRDDIPTEICIKLSNIQIVYISCSQPCSRCRTQWVHMHIHLTLPGWVNAGVWLPPLTRNYSFLVFF